MDIGKTVTLIPGRTLNYADPRGPHYPQLCCYKDRAVQCPVGLVDQVNKHDPDAEWPKVKALETPEGDSGENSEEKQTEIEDKSDKSDTEVPEKAESGEKKAKKTKFLGKGNK